MGFMLIHSGGHFVGATVTVAAVDSRSSRANHCLFWTKVAISIPLDHGAIWEANDTLVW